MDAGIVNYSLFFYKYIIDVLQMIHKCFSGSYAPWCPACKALKNTWDDLSAHSKELFISVGQVDVTLCPGLSGRFMVTALPTIFQ